MNMNKETLRQFARNKVMVVIKNASQEKELKHISKTNNVIMCAIQPNVEDKIFPKYYSIVDMMTSDRIVLIPDLNREELIDIGWVEMEYKTFKRQSKREKI